MLDLIRKKQKSVIIKVVFWAIIAAFVGTIFLVWGKGSDQGGQGAQLAARVDGVEIGYGEFQQSYSNLYRLYQNIYREQFTPALEQQLNLEKQALDMLVDQVLLVREAQRKGIQVSEKELVESIANIPAFQQNGVFNKDLYLNALNYQRMTPEEFEAGQRRELLVEKLRRQIQEQVSIAPDEVEEEFRKRNEKVNLAFLRFAPPLYENKVVIDEQELAAFFENNREDFRLPTKVALKYLEFEPARYADEIVPEDQDLQRYYRRNLARYEVPEEIEASHILIKVPAGAEEEEKTEKRKLIESLLEDVKAGKDFSELARTYSDDTGSASAGGALGYFGRGVMVAPFEEAAFSLEPGEVSGIVETEFGFHIIKVTGYQEAAVKPLADVMEQVKTGVRQELARQLAFEKAMDAYNMFRKTGDIEGAAAANDLGVKETGLFSRNEAIDGIGRSEEVTAAAFTLEKGEFARPVDLPQGIFLFTLKEKQESRLPELEEVRSEVEEAFRKQKAQELALEAAERALEELKNGKDLAAVAKAAGIEVQKTDFFSRTYGDFIPRIGSSEALAKDAFELSQEQPVAAEVYPVDSKYVVAELQERQEADPEQLDEAKRSELREALLARKKEEQLTEKIEALREQAEIEILINVG